MSWRLLPSNDSDKPYFLLPTSVCRVGRQGCQITIPDTTVSRHHADILVTTQVRIRDVSKFVQTAVNGILLSQDAREVAVHHGDVLTFGASPDTFTLQWEPIVVRSTLPMEEVADIARSVGVLVQTDASEKCAGLIVGELDPNSLDVVRAICNGVPIISLKFLQALQNVQSGSRELPTITEYAFPIPQACMSRNALFADCDFFLSPFLELVREVIVACGGRILKDCSKATHGLFVMCEKEGANSLQLNCSQARLVSWEAVAKDIFEARLEILESIPVTKFQAQLTDGRKGGIQEKSLWIETRSYASRDSENIPTAQMGPITASHPVKRFRKATPPVTELNPVRLEPWTGTVITNKSQNSDSVVLRNSCNDGLDAWINSCNSQG